MMAAKSWRVRSSPLLPVADDPGRPDFHTPFRPTPQSRRRSFSAGARKAPADAQKSPKRAPGTQKLQREEKATNKRRSLPQAGRIGRKDSNTVFVAGSTGRLGLRIVRQLLLSGFSVRAGARNVEKAQEYTTLAVSLGILPPDAARKLKIVSVDLEEPQTISPAIGNAAKVVQAIGASESNVLDFGAPKRVDGDAAISLITAAVQAGVQQYIMISSLGAGKFGWPASALNLFGGVLVQKRRAERALEKSGLAYIIVRPGGMERPSDDYKLTNNVRLQGRDSLFGGQVSRLQVAELVTAAARSPELAENKVLEVVAEAKAPLLSYTSLLQKQQSDASQQDCRGQSRSTAQLGGLRVADAERPQTEAQKTQPGKAPGRRQKALAEEIPKKEIKLKLGQAGSRPSRAEKKVAEGIAQKEIAISNRDDSPVKFEPVGKLKSFTSKRRAPSAVGEVENQQRGAGPAEQLEQNAEREQVSNATAQKEAAFLAKLENEKAEAELKRLEARKKRADEARSNYIDLRNANLAKQEKLKWRETGASLRPKEGQSGSTAAPGTSPADVSQKNQKAAEEQASPEEQASTRVGEARERINAWQEDRKFNGSKKAEAESAAKKPDVTTGKNELEPAQTNGAQEGETSENVKEAREWIRNWRARTLEAKLPEGSSSRK